MSRTIVRSGGGVNTRARARRRVGLLASLALGALAACSADREPARGQLMLAMQTDMSLPKDVSSIRIQIRRLGESVFDRSYPVGDGAVKLPATLAVVASDDPSDTVEIRVLAFRGDEVRTLNRTITTVPESRIALLRVPVQWLCDGFVTATGDGDERSFESSCEADEDGDRACVAGSCVSVAVASAELPEFEPEQVFGGADTPSDEGRCFPTETCFDAGFDVTADDGCTVELAAAESDEANFALRTGLGADGICSARDCYVPLDSADGFGFVEIEGTASLRRFQLPEGVCRAVDDGRAAALVASLACRTKTPSTPTCGPWSSVEGDGADSVIDGRTPGAGGAPGAGGQGGTPSGGGGDAGAGNDGGVGGTPAGEGGGETGGSDSGGSGGEAGSTGGGGTVTATTPIALGWGHSCRITDGSLICWGENGDGQIGDGTTVKRSLPAAVQGLTGVVSVALGRAHTCALDSGGSVWCWGNGMFGQIGTSELTGSVVPVEVYQGAVSIAAGSDHTCAATGAGNVVCWGDNSVGQLGNASAGTISGNPVEVEGLPSALSLAAFGGRTCAVSDDGSVSCWGSVMSGETRARVLSFADVSAPRGVSLVEGVENAVSVAVGGEHACAASADGSLRCWGDNAYGQLGTFDNAASVTPVLAGAVEGAVEVVAGNVHTCVRLAGGTVSCFGGNEDGQLGVPSGPSSSVPAAVPGVHGVTALSAGPRHVCAVLGQDSTMCWGNNDSGQLGNGAVSRGGGESPVIVAVGFDATRGEGRSKLAVGYQHACAVVTEPGTTPWPSEPFAFLGGGNGASTCAVDEASRLWCWGYGSVGQLGGGNTSSFGVPTLNGLTDVVSVASSYGHACAVLGDGSVACWGDNFTGQIGDGSTISSWFPVLVTGVSNAVEVVVGDYHSCALDALGAVKCWGAGEYGELGDGNGSASLVPVTVALPQAASGIGAGISHTCAVLLDGTVSCWGANDSGQIDSTFYTMYSPSAVPGVTGALHVDGGGQHTCALLASGGIKCWGYNFSGQIGAGLSDTYRAATDVTGIDDAVAIDLGYNHTCAIRSGGYPTCWGDNSAGQLGTGNYDASNVPVIVGGYPAGGVSGLLASGTHSCLLTDAGELACFGNNYNGQLGIANRDAVWSATPVVRPGAPPAAGAVACWGDNNARQTGTNGGSDVLVPRVVPSMTAVAVAAGAMHSCALEEAGGVKCWGDNLYNQLGDVEASPGLTPVAIAGVANAHGIVAGRNHTCALLETGGVTCWGENTYAQLGHEAPSSVGAEPVQGLPATATAVAAGYRHTCALHADGTVSCWGDDQYGQLGSGATGSPRATPGIVPGVSGLRALALGAYHACGVTHDGRVYCWGENNWSQLGDTASAGVSGPALVNGVANVVGIGTGEKHTCAVTATGTVFCWGTGYNGALGSPGTTSATPLEVANLSGVVTLDLSGSYFYGGESEAATSCAFGFDGSVHCWGASSRGLLGDGSLDTISVQPVRALLP